MRISLNWVKKYVNIPISDAELVRLIGARLVEVEEVIDETHKYDNIFVVKVEKAEKIPDTHLTLCQINVGELEIPKVEKNADGLVQVVCGAPNVHAGMLAAWIAPGAVVPASVHEAAPFVIGKRKMLGKFDSNGMLAAMDELDLGDDHEGIVEIDPNMAKPGEAFAEVFDLNDLILDIENKSLTHRPDTFGLIGFAREVAGILGQKFECDYLSEKLPNLPDKKAPVSITITDETICPRYSAVILEKHGEIKKKYLNLQDTLLAKAGMRPIDPIVDATNYLMLLTGQPLHAFDYDKFVKVGGSETPKVIVRLARKGEKLVLLDDEEIELNENDIVITSNDKPVALAGAMGGKSTMIDENTRNILVESATFSLYNLRKTQMSHGIFSEAITRFTKGQPAYQTLPVALKCADMLKDGFAIDAVADEYPDQQSKNVVKITTDEINDLLGTNYQKDLIVNTLSNVEFKVEPDGDTLCITAPSWRTDIHIEEDIIEEIGRLLGFDNIEPVLPLHATAEKNALFELKKYIRDLLSKYGANEVLTYSFVSGNVLEKAGLNTDNSYKIVNSISPDLQFVRQSIMPSLLDKAYLNEKLPVDQFAIFEMNKVYRKDLGMDDENVPQEKISLGFLVAERKNNQTAFYLAKKYVAKLFEELNIEVDYLSVKQNNPEILPFEPKRTAEIWANGEYLGIVGEFKNSVRNNFKLAPFLAGFEIDLLKILNMASLKKTVCFGQKKIEDLTITTDKTYAEALEEVQAKYPNAKIMPGTIYQAEGQKTRNITFHIELML
ncbi:phenylalanine--tRNA ligase subunit beta [Candidatus Saccharibacteria bacterium]|nr:phenylalanine--tRNA ligase subunit beta [Candidatus Saccharibacteria bacterium]